MNGLSVRCHRKYLRKNTLNYAHICMLCEIKLRKQGTHSRNVIFGVKGSTIDFFRTVDGGFPF